MTTSFAHFVRGQLLQSAKANLAGLVLAACCAAQIPWSLKVAISGRSRAVYSLLEILLTISVVVTLIAFIQWGVRLLF